MACARPPRPMRMAGDLMHAYLLEGRGFDVPDRALKAHLRSCVGTYSHESGDWSGQLVRAALLLNELVSSRRPWAAPVSFVGQANP